MCINVCICIYTHIGTCPTTRESLVLSRNFVCAHFLLFGSTFGLVLVLSLHLHLALLHSLSLSLCLSPSLLLRLALSLPLSPSRSLSLSLSLPLALSLVLSLVRTPRELTLSLRTPYTNRLLFAGKYTEIETADAITREKIFIGVRDSHTRNRNSRRNNEREVHVLTLSRVDTLYIYRSS